MTCVHMNRNFSKLRMATKYVKDMLLSKTPRPGRDPPRSEKCKKRAIP